MEENDAMLAKIYKQQYIDELLTLG